MATDLSAGLSTKTFVFGLKLWVLTGVTVGLFIVIILVVLSFCLTSRKRSRKANDMLPVGQIPTVSEEIKEIKVDEISANYYIPHHDAFLTINEKLTDRELEKVMVHSKNGDNNSQSGSFNHTEQEGISSHSGEEVGSGKLPVYNLPPLHSISAGSPLSGLPEFSHLGWGH